jgi:hypothetical protein
MKPLYNLRNRAKYGYAYILIDIYIVIFYIL